MKQLQQPSIHPTQFRRQAKRQYFTPFEQFSMALPHSPILRSMQMGEHSVHQQASQQRYANPQASMECQESIQTAELQAVEVRQQHCNIFLNVSAIAFQCSKFIMMKNDFIIYVYLLRTYRIYDSNLKPFQYFQNPLLLQFQGIKPRLCKSTVIQALLNLYSLAYSSSFHSHKTLLTQRITRFSSFNLQVQSVQGYSFLCQSVSYNIIFKGQYLDVILYLYQLLMNRLLSLKQSLVSQTKLEEQELSIILFGPHYKNRKLAWDVIRNSKVLQDHFHLHNYSLKEIRQKTIDKLIVATKHTPNLEEIKKSNFQVGNSITAYCNGVTFNDMNFCIRGGVHNFLYSRGIYLLGTQKHKDILNRAILLKDIGCFGLTELNHGSNVKGMETQAHYDHQNKQFVINTPHRGAMKFWIGAAAHSATMSIIWAQLYIGNKCYGVHAFLVPLRDRQTYKLLPGVLVGDCGHKSGLNGVDNGFILFENYRIPKDNLLDKLSSINDKGEFFSTIKSDQKRFGLQLSALSGGRFLIATNCSALALQALTIAIRYCNERRQFKGPNDTQEKKLIEYPLMKRRLMPLLASTLVYYRASMHFIKLSDDNVDNLTDQHNPLIQQLHAISSIMKAKTSWFASECIQQCREAMGGHGYSSYSKIGSLYNDNDINLTWQGDNHVLIQQTSKYVLQQAQKVIQKGQQSNNPLLKFLSDPPQDLPEINKENLLCLNKGLQFLQYKLMRKIEDTGMRMLQLKNKKLPIMDIWNNAQVFLGRDIAMTYGDIALLTVMREGIALAKNPANRELLETSLRLWLLIVYRKDEYIDMTHHSLIQSLIRVECSKLQKVSLQLLTLIAPDDVITGSPFADPNGKGMQKYMDIILSKPTNQRVQWWQTLLER